MIKRSTRFFLPLGILLILALLAGVADAARLTRVPKPPRNPASMLRVTFLDVGQGDAILLRTADKTVLIDAGDDRANAASRAIIPFLKKEGIKKIDTCVISHPHRDHFGGYLELVEAVEIGEFLYSTDAFGGEDPEGGAGDVVIYKKTV
jgi:competence protein ComEC